MIHLRTILAKLMVQFIISGVFTEANVCVNASSTVSNPAQADAHASASATLAQTVNRQQEPPADFE